MNDDILLAVHCYAGEQQQVEELLPFWKRHGTPVLLLSPQTAPVQVSDPDVECRWAGQHGWAGGHTIDRQILHWEILHCYSQRFVMYHDADSILLPEEIPDNVKDDRMWSNESDSMEFLRRIQAIKEGTDYIGPDSNERVPQVRAAAEMLVSRGLPIEKVHELNPTVAQPPYFVSQETLESMLALAYGVWTNRLAIPFIDWFWGALGTAGVPHSGFGSEGVSVPMHEPEWKERALPGIRSGQTKWVHAVKTGALAEELLEAAP